MTCAAFIAYFLICWAHILAAALVAGGAFYLKFVLTPALRGIPPQHGKWLLEGARRRWMKIVIASCSILVLGGLANVVRVARHFEFPNGAYYSLLAVKVVLAAAAFFIASSLVSRGARTVRFRRNSSFWLSVNVCLLILVLGIATLLAQMDRKAKSVHETGSLRQQLADGLPPG